MKKRILAVLLLVAMLLSMLAACGGNTTPEQPSNQGSTNQPSSEKPAGNEGKDEGPQTVGNFAVPAGGYDGSAVTIKFYNTMGANLSEPA